MSEEVYKVSCVVCHLKGRLVTKAVESILKSKGVEVEVIVMSSDKTFSHTRAKTIYME